MKKLILVSVFITALTFTGCVITSETTTNKVVYHPNQSFRDLDRYGTWVDIPDYGTVWKPFDEINWQPYTDGQWVLTDQGWMWDSNEPYGWIVYHYGYWQYSDFDGWFWIPGYEWSPARVTWYRDNDYVGWAPLPPPGVSRTVIYNNVYVNRVWIIVPERNFADRNIVQYRNRSYSPDITVLRSNNGGRAPEVRDVERASNRQINTIQPTREQINSGNRQLTRVRVQNNNTPVSPTTTGNQSNPVRTRGDNNSGNVNPQKPVSNPPEINDRRPVNNGVQRQPAERNTGQQNNIHDNTQKNPPQGARNNNTNVRNGGRSNNRNQENTGRSDSTKNAQNKNRSIIKKQPVAPPQKDQNTDQKDETRGRADDRK